MQMATANVINVSNPAGFNSTKDTVGPGIYSGNVLKNENNQIVYGTQYENHNPLPGPTYSNSGYTDISKAIHTGDCKIVRDLLKQYPALANEISTGGATPLHTCGMSKKGQAVTQVVIDAGGDINAIDTYGYKPLHRMASNNLALGAVALLSAGANAKDLNSYDWQDALAYANAAGAKEVKVVLEFYIAGLGRISKH